MPEIRKADWKWLRCASLRHDGFLDGMPWGASPYAFERLEQAGLVTRAEHHSPLLKSTFSRAVITEAGIKALAAQGEKLKRKHAPHAEQEQAHA